MDKSRKAELRDSIRMWSSSASLAKSNMGFWFRVRHDWSTSEDTKEGNYNYCYQMYKSYKRTYQKSVERVVYWTKKYLAEYKG